MENIKTLARQFFPFKEFNPGQHDAIVSCVQAILDGKRHIILNSPVATGKSAIATTVHRILRHLKKSWRTTIITTSKGLQAQYVSSEPEICDLKGRKNYHCQHGTYYGSPDCKKYQSMNECYKKTQCQYYMRRVEWSKNAPLRLTNTSFHIIAGASILANDETRADLVVVDECHELDKQIVEHATINVNVKRHYIEKVFGDWGIGTLAEFINIFMNQSHGVPFSIIENREYAAGVTQFVKELNEMLKNLESLESEGNTKEDILTGAKEEVETLLDEMSNLQSRGEWLIMDYSMSNKVSIKPVYASQVAQSSFFYKSPRFLHMSATICGFEEYCNNLGIDHKEAVYIDVKNPIPIERRKVIALNAIKVSNGYDEKKHAEIIDAIIAKHGNENGVIHTVSFKLAESLKNHSKYSNRMIISNDRREILTTLKNFDSGKIILSPSITTGYDFKGGLARWQIIAKLAFPYLGDVWVKLNKDRSPRWYSRETILSLVQASGRVCRGMEDKGITYIIDTNFMFLFRGNHDLFPEWFTESIIIPRRK